MNDRLIWFMMSPRQRFGAVVLKGTFFLALAGTSVAGLIAGIELGDWISDQIPELQEIPTLDTIVQLIAGGTLAAVAGSAFTVAVYATFNRKQAD